MARGKRPPKYPPLTVSREDIFNFAIHEAERREPFYPVVYVVHGTVDPYTGKGVSRRGPHAWVEFGINREDALAYDLLRAKFRTEPLALANYESQMVPRHVIRYTIEQAWALRRDTGHWGPWT